MDDYRLILLLTMIWLMIGANWLSAVVIEKRIKEDKDQLLISYVASTTTLSLGMFQILSPALMLLLAP